MANGTRFHDDEVHPGRQPGEGYLPHPPGLAQAPDRRSEVGPLPPVQCLVGESEVAPAAPADLDDHELGRRPGIDRHEVQLASPGPDVPGEDRPARGDQPLGDPLLGVVSGLLGGRASSRVARHRVSIADRDHPAITRRCTWARLGRRSPGPAAAMLAR